MKRRVVGVVTSVIIRCHNFLVTIYMKTAEDVVVPEVRIALMEAAAEGSLPPLTGRVDEESITVEVVDADELTSMSCC